jgi:hypothetical protein
MLKLVGFDVEYMANRPPRYSIVFERINEQLLPHLTVFIRPGLLSLVFGLREPNDGVKNSLAAFV